MKETTFCTNCELVDDCPTFMFGGIGGSCGSNCSWYIEKKVGFRKRTKELLGGKKI